MKREAINIQGTKREFTCVSFSLNEEKFLFVGTTSADFFVIDHKTKSLLTVISIGALGITQIAALTPEEMLVACGNGIVAKYMLDARGWSLAAKLDLKQKITSLSSAGKEALIGTNVTQAIILNLTTFQPYLFQESHNAKINFIKFRDGDSNTFGAASDDGTIRVWDLSSRTVTGTSPSPSENRSRK